MLLFINVMLINKNVKMVIPYADAWEGTDSMSLNDEWKVNGKVMEIILNEH